MSTVIDSKIQGIMRWLLLLALFLLGITPASAHYDPRTGRWLSRDPLGEEGGPNLYAYCANDPVNKHDPLGLADWNTVAVADNVDMLIAIAELTDEFGDGTQAQFAQDALWRSLSRDPEPWASSIYRSGGTAGLANYVANRDRILGETFQMGATGLFYGGAALRTVGGAMEIGVGVAWSWGTGSIGAFLGGGALALNGWDNMQSGVRTIVSGEYQPAWLENQFTSNLGNGWGTVGYIGSQFAVGGLPWFSRVASARLAPHWNLGNYYPVLGSTNTGLGNFVFRAPMPGRAVVRLRYEPGWNLRDFNRKAGALQDLARRGKLRKAANPVARDDGITVAYKSRLIQAVYAMHGKTDPARYLRLRQRIRALQADHMQDLQVMGVDSPVNLWLLDGEVNTGLGNQLWQQIRGLDTGTIIDDVIIEGLP